MIDAGFPHSLDSSLPLRLQVTLQGAGLMVRLNGSPITSFNFNAALVDGGFGLLVQQGSTTFDILQVRTDYRAFDTESSSEPEDNLLAAGNPDADAQLSGAVATGTSLAEVESELLEATLAAAIELWKQSGQLNDDQLAFLDTVTLQVTDLEGPTLATATGSTITLDENAAGHGWFIDATPDDNGEFVVAPDGTLTAAEGSDADGQMDLLTVLLHEIGHTIRLLHFPTGDYVMFGGKPLPLDIHPDEIAVVRLHAALPKRLNLSVYDMSKP